MSYQLKNRYVTSAMAMATRGRALRTGHVNMTDHVNDLTWANFASDMRSSNAYYDYFFAPEDIKVYVAELEDDSRFGNLPIHSFGFNVNQEKAPIYGYASFTYDGVMRGTRLITGSFVLISKSPNYMKDLLATAASVRASRGKNIKDDYPVPATWRADDANIEKYWGRHIDASAAMQGQNEWSVHPPFSFVIVYGIQETSLELNGISDRYNHYGSNNALLQDRNQRLVEGFSPNDSSRIVIDGVELMSVERAFAPESPLVAERYEFFGRELIVPPPNFKTNHSSHSLGPAVPNWSAGQGTTYNPVTPRTNPGQVPYV